MPNLTLKIIENQKFFNKSVIGTVKYLLTKLDQTFLECKCKTSRGVNERSDLIGREPQRPFF